MKIARIVCTVLMAFLCALGWFSQLHARSASESRYTAELESARSLASRGLHQRAIQSFEAALNIREDGEIRQELLEVYALAYEDGSITRNSYKNALEGACQRDPKEAGLWARLIRYYCDTNNYREAYKALGRAERAGAGSAELDALSVEVCYSYTESGQVFAQFCSAPGSYTTIYNGARWGVIAPDGEREYDCDYAYISPYNKDGAALFCTEDSVRLLDGKEVLLAILKEPITRARAYGSGLLPVYQDSRWQYLDCENDAFLPGVYDDASSFQNGIAAVRQGGSWALIDSAGNRAADQMFSDIKLYGNGGYCMDKLFAASTDAGWDLYQTDGKRVSEISARDMDLYLGSHIAFQDASGLWGFMDRKGKIVIEPRYQQARSFSGGLAAVFDGNNWGFIDKSGETVIGSQFLEVGYFSDQGVCPVSTIEDQFHMITLRFPGGS